ncbi:hypothetical protein ACI6PS_02460 [Flavobacterium sp. PLA-1-15]|uniref:hypothetical protein n=1 Tax=Flavobacterium sp. PLA-1-15 TaxID=3380533 RepID=UPI003B77AB96
MSTNLINFEDKVNSPALLAYLQQFGPETFVTAEELNSFRDAINYLGKSIDNNGFVVKKNHGFTGNNYVIEPLFKWIIDQIPYSNVMQVTLNVPFAATGKTRGETIVATTENTFIRIAAPESSTVTAFPDIPMNTIALSSYIVRDNSIDTPTVPVPVTNYIEKEERSARILNTSGVVGIVGMNTKQSRLCISFTASITQLSGISKIYSSDFHDGQPFIVQSLQPGSFLIKHNDTLVGSGTKFFFPDKKDFIVYQDYILIFMWDVPNNLLRFVSASQKMDDYKQENLIDFKFNTTSVAGFSNTAISGGTIITQSDSLSPVGLRYDRPSDIGECWTLRGSAANANSGYMVGYSSQNPMYLESTLFMVINPLRLTNTIQRYGLISNVVSPLNSLVGSTAICIEINNDQLTFKASDSNVSTTIAYTITSPQWLYVMIEVESATSIRCKVRLGLNGPLVFNQALSTNLPISVTGSKWAQLRLYLGAVTTIASADNLVQIGRFATYPKKPHYLKYF